jgi:hypothetical protein
MTLLLWVLLAAAWPLVARAGGNDVPYCFFDGCASASVCKCHSFFQECDTGSEAQGFCKLTPWGIAVIVIIVVLFFALLVAVFCLLYCCKKVFCCCCKRRRESSHHQQQQPVHTTVYYHPPQAHGTQLHEML